MSVDPYFECEWEKWNSEEKVEREREGHTGDVGLWDAIQNNSYRGILQCGSCYDDVFLCVIGFTLESLV
jgi:hypothetical protein